LSSLENVKGWLIDLDGTLFIGNALIPGASELLRRLRSENWHFRLVSNSTVYSRQQIAERLRGLGFEVADREVFTPASATAELLRTFGGVKCFLIVADNLLEEFGGIEISEKNPDYVVFGDIGAAMDYAMMNRIFRLVMGGSELISLQKNRFFRNADGLQIDAGAFVAGLEYSTGKQARIIGKPARQFFNLAIHDIRVQTGQRWLSAEFAMVGDDIEADIKGAMDAGLTGVLVKTGKHNDSYSEHFGIVPDWTFDSVKQLAESLH
jgi:HAD superfamily hydrolase (TIGR01458 family)